jgi:hypothetical protein
MEHIRKTKQDDDIGGKCDVHWADKKGKQHFSQRDHMGYLGVDLPTLREISWKWSFYLFIGLSLFLILFGKDM